MTLDDRSLREHLDRRAEAGVSDVEGIAEVTMIRVAELDRGRWWRRLGVRTPSLGVAAALVAVLIVALAVLPPRIWPGPGSSPTSSGPAVAADYPANRPLTAGELRTLLAGDTARLADAVLIVDVELRETTVSCALLALCATFAIDFGNPASPIYVTDPHGVASVGVATYALHVRGKSLVDVVGRVRPGPDGLAWTLHQLIDGLEEIRGSSDWRGYMYLVDAVRVISTISNLCPEPRPTNAMPQFECGVGDPAWLVPDEASVPTAFTRAPVDSLRVSNVHGVDDRSTSLVEHGFWLLNPLANQLFQNDVRVLPPADGFVEGPCYLCPAAGSAELLGRVPTFQELGLGPSPTTTPAVGEHPADRPLTADELGELLTSDPDAVIGLTIVADVDVIGSREVCDITLCGDHRIELPTAGLEIAVNTNTMGGPLLDPPYALRFVDATSVDLLATVRPATSALTWTLDAYLAELSDLLQLARLTSHAYLVEAVAVQGAAGPCESAENTGSTFDVGCGLAAWLIPLDTTIPGGGFTHEPDVALRIQNDAPIAWSQDGSGVHGYFLVRPFGVESCYMCSTDATSQLLGSVDPIDVSRTSPPSTAPATTEPTRSARASELAVENIHFSSDFVTLIGFETADLTVTMSLVGDVVPYHGADASLTPLVILQRDAGDTGDPLDPHIAQLVRTMRQSPVAGLWTATFRLTSGDRGIWRVDGLTAYNAAGHELNISPAIRDASPRLEVVGTDVPHLTMELEPSPLAIGQPLEVTGQVTDEDTGEPLGGVVVSIGRGPACSPGGIGTSVETNPNGAYSFVFAEADQTPVCAWISGEPGLYPSFDSEAPVALYGILFAYSGDS